MEILSGKLTQTFDALLLINFCCTCLKLFCIVLCIIQELIKYKCGCAISKNFDSLLQCKWSVKLSLCYDVSVRNGKDAHVLNNSSMKVTEIS